MGPVSEHASASAAPIGSPAEVLSALEPMQRVLDLGDLQAEIAHAMLSVLPLDACCVSTVDADEGIVRDVAASLAGGRRWARLARVYELSDYPLTARVLADGQPAQVSLGDSLLWPTEAAVLRDLGYSRVLMARIAQGERPVALVECYRASDEPFSPAEEREVDLLCALAGGAWSRIEASSRTETEYTATIEALAAALEARDPGTREHAARIRDLAGALAVALGLPPEERRAIRLGALLHDVGKIGVPDAILSKPAPLAPDEQELIREHPLIGERVLAGVAFLENVRPIVRHHHERWDGSGYPDGLAGTAIPLGARIVAVCDAFDAMTSDRPYRRALPVSDACATLVAGAGRQFDPDCARLLVELVREAGTDGIEARVIRYR